MQGDVDGMAMVRETYAKTESQRAMCEAIWVSKNLRGDQREEFFQRVAQRRGPDAARRLRADVRDYERAC